VHAQNVGENRHPVHALPNSDVHAADCATRINALRWGRRKPPVAFDARPACFTFV